MPLDALPTELLLQIFRYAGANECPQHTTLLVLSRRCYEVISSIEFEQLNLSPNKIGNFLISQDKPAMPGVVARLKTNVKAMNVDLCKIALDLSMSHPAERTRRCLVKEGYRWRIPSMLSVHRLAGCLKSCPRLKSLDIRAAVNRPASVPIWSLPQILEIDDFHTILDVRRRDLTSLVIDIQYDCYHPGSIDSRTQTCHVIAGLIPNLRRLCVRMPYMCSQLLSLETAPNTLPLQELVINLTTWTKMGRNGFLDSSHSCGSGHEWQVDNVPAMCIAAQELVKRAPYLKIARLIKRESFKSPLRDHENFSTMNVALDCLSGREGLVPKNADWTRDIALKYPVFPAAEVGRARKRRSISSPRKE